MNSRKMLFVLCAVLAVVFFFLCLSIVQQQGRPAHGTRAGGKAADPAQQAMGGAAGAAAGAGMLDRVMGSYVDRVGGPRAPAGPDAAQAAAGSSGAGTGAQADADAARKASENAADEEKERLRLIHMKDREQGGRRLYGAGGSSSASALAVRRSGASASGRRAQPEDETQVLNKFQAFVEKLHQRAASGKGGVDGQATARSALDASGQASRVNILSVDGFKGDKPPTLKVLEKVNQDGADSVMMTANPELEDGSKDKHGKNFDGNSVTFETIPIDEVNGAFGGKEIRANPSAVDTGGGAPADLKH
jgi:hypothetical protein